MADAAAAVEMDTDDGPNGALNGAADNTHGAAAPAPDDGTAAPPDGGEGGAAVPNDGATAPPEDEPMYTPMNTGGLRPNRPRRAFPDPEPPMPHPPTRGANEPWAAHQLRRSAWAAVHGDA